MGTVNRTGKRKTAKKTAKKKGTKTNGTTAIAGGLNPLLLDDVNDLASELTAKLTKLAEQTVGAVEDGVYTQAAMAAYLKLEAIQRQIGAGFALVLTDLRHAALTHQNTGGAFEQGKCVVTFPVTGGRRSPKWKDEAVKKASELAGLRHGVQQTLTGAQVTKVEKAAATFVFDEKAYGKAVLEATPAGSTSVSVNFTEGA